MYIVADKYCISDLQAQITKVFEMYFSMKTIQNLYSHHSYFKALRIAGLTECPLTQLLLKNLCDDLRRHGWEAYVEEIDPELPEELMKDPQTMLDLMRDLANSDSHLDSSVRARKRQKRLRSPTMLEKPFAAPVYRID